MSLATLENIRVELANKVILTDVSLAVRRQEIVTLIGPNGAGKSTLLKVVLGLIRPTRGEVRIAENIQVGYMPQGITIESYMPLSVQRFLKLAGRFKQDALTRVMQELEINHLRETPLQSVSGGERQRVLLARALLQKPDLLVLDEPVQGVDVAGQEAFYQLISVIRDRYQCGILMVSHDLYLVMAGTDSVICLNKHICCSGNPLAVSQHPEFLNLFGSRKPPGLMIYTHQHNHQHDGESPCL